MTPEIISGRINPWASLERPDDGLWEFTKNINSAQNQAERRREFYVALTRVENHLIIVGNSTNKGQICPETGMIQFTSKPSEKTMGHMWMEGLRAGAHKQNQLESPWLKPGDIGVEELGQYQEHDVSLDPVTIYFNSQLGEDNIRSMAIFHNPDCFSDAKPVTPIERWSAIEDKITAKNSPHSTIKISKNVTHTLKLGANSLDNSVKCRKHHWPNNLTNWNNHRLSKLLEKTSSVPEKIGNLPTAVEFGLMMHRLVEISLDNPSKYNAKPTKPLPNSWFNKPEHDLTSDESIEIVLGEFGFNKSDKGNTKRFNATFERMQSVANLVDQGLTGRYAKGEKLHGRKAEGLRTELPFLYNHIVNVNSPRKVFRNNNLQEISNVANVEIIFEGRADLVMAYSDDAGNGYLQVVDMKTTGCLYGFNFDDPKHGTALQQFTGDLHNFHPSSQAEHDIIDKYKYQLTLYSKALEAIEAEKPIEERRTVLPPAILIAASGRTVEMSKEYYQQTIDELDEQLVWIGQLAANPQSIDEPDRMTMEHAMVCWNTGIEPQD